MNGSQKGQREIKEKTQSVVKKSILITSGIVVILRFGIFYSHMLFFLAYVCVRVPMGKDSMLMQTHHYLFAMS